MPTPSHELNAVGACIFAGGFTIGTEKHFNVLAHLELGPYGVKTFQLNRPDVPVFIDKTGAWSDQVAKLRETGVDYVYCNPPCAPFSVAGKSIKNGVDNWKSDPRTSCIRHCFDLLEKLQPTVLVIESVVAAYQRGAELFNELRLRAHSLGYAVTHTLIDARWHRVPQRRKRYFFIAHKVQLSFVPLNYGPPTTVAEVLELVQAPGYYHPHSASWNEPLAKCKPWTGLREAWELHNWGETRPRVAGEGPVKGRPRMMEHRLGLDREMGAFIGDFFYHPTEDRRLGINEAKALCGFPPDWKFFNERHGFSELARGVMPNVADWLAESVKNSILDARRNRRLLHADETVAANYVNLQKPPEETTTNATA